MKTKNTTTSNSQLRSTKNRTAPDVRDNLDSRKKEEQHSKGDDITHNRKPHHNKQQRPK